MKKKISRIRSTAVPLPIENIDTDQIIPSRFLKALSKKGFGKNLFHDWRYDKHGKCNKKFILNNRLYSGKILVCGRNFGCGSSREHAAWALIDYGFSVVVSSYFADIFKTNALNNGLLPIQIPEKKINKMLIAIKKNPHLIFEVDLKNQLFISQEMQLKELFRIHPYKKTCLMNGYDDVEYILSMKEKIITFENNNK